jgi:hypothetical protein
MQRRRGQVFENLGGDLPGAPCACAECSEAPSDALACAAHGVPLAFDAVLPLWLPVFPPRFVDVVDDAGRDNRLPVAQPGVGHAPWAAASAPGTIDLGSCAGRVCIQGTRFALACTRKTRRCGRVALPRWSWPRATCPRVAHRCDALLGINGRARERGSEGARERGVEGAKVSGALKRVGCASRSSARTLWSGNSRRSRRSSTTPSPPPPAPSISTVTRP